MGLGQEKPGMHIQPDLNSGGRTGNVKCYSHGSVIDGSFKIQNNNSFAPTVIKCGICVKNLMIVKVIGYILGANKGRCCLKTGLTPKQQKSFYKPRGTDGMYMVVLKMVLWGQDHGEKV